jgi:hypothetical protein
MAFNVIGAVETEVVWYKVASGGSAISFFAPELQNSNFAKFTFFSSTSAATPSVTVTFTSINTPTVASAISVDYDTASSANTSELVMEIPVGSTNVSFSQQGYDFFVLAEYSTKTYTSSIAVAKYITTQSITLSKTSTVVLLGAGGGGRGGGNQQHGGGGGSGYITSGTVSPGTYTLTVGAGGGSNANGGSTTFAGLTAAGGLASTGTSTNDYARGGNGGSGGGGGREYDNLPGSGGVNGGNGGSGGKGVGGIGSGVVPTLFRGEAVAIGRVNEVGLGGGVYNGGAGGTMYYGGAQNGLNATGSGGGGGGGAITNVSTTCAGGTGGTGALYVLTQ